MHQQEDTVEHRNYFDNRYLHRNSIANQFLEEVVQTVPLHELKEVVDSCYYDESMDFCAVLSQINH